MKKLIGILAGMAVIAAGVWFYKAENKPVEAGSKPVVKIGVMYPLSGELASMGNAGKIGIEVAKQKIDKMDTKYDYEFIFEDNQFNNAKSASVLNKFLNVDKIDVLIDSGAGVGNVSSPIMEKNKLIHFNWSSDPNVAKGKYNFINWTQPPAQAEKMAKVIKNKGYQNIWIVTANHAGPIAVTEGLAKELSNENIAYNVKKFNIGSRDMRMDIREISESKADLIVIVLFDPDLSIFLKQLKELDVHTDLTAIEVFSFLENPSVVEGSWYIDAAEGDNEVTDEVRRRTGSNVILGASNSYDIVMLLVKAFETAATKEQAVDELLKIKNYKGYTGDLAQDENGIFQSEAIVKVIKDGKPIVIEE